EVFVGIRLRLVAHGHAQHVQDVGALLVDEDAVRAGRAIRIEALPLRDRPGLIRGQARAALLLEDALPLELIELIERARAFAQLEHQARGELGEAFGEPLVVIAAPADLMSPPLVGHFVRAEVTHQWWGHQVGWRSYHDQWLSEGFAEFPSGLVLELRKGPGALNEFYELKRKRILEKQRGASLTSDQAGPITQGQRLNTYRTPGAYGVLVYEKGAYILHMLRMTMRDQSKPNPDEDF